jgi:hypothetical protein
MYYIYYIVVFRLLPMVSQDVQQLQEITIFLMVGAGHSECRFILIISI